MQEVKRRDIYLVSQFKVRIRLDQIPVSEAMLINAKQEQNVVLLIPVHVKVGNLDPAGQFKPAANTDLSYLMCNTKQRAVLPLFHGVGSHLFLSAGLAGTALCRGSNSSSCWMMDLALTCTPEILMLIPRRFPGPLAGRVASVFFRRGPGNVFILNKP